MMGSKHVANKPQGFKEGQLAKRGIFTCFWGCGKEFFNLEDAKFHWETELCLGKDTSDKTVEKLHEIARSTIRLEKPVLQPLKVRGRKTEAGNSTAAGTFLETRTNRVKTLKELLKTLPESDSMIDTEHWVLTTPFSTTFC